jgi:hypothetical protein
MAAELVQACFRGYSVRSQSQLVQRPQPYVQEQGGDLFSAVQQCMEQQQQLQQMMMAQQQQLAQQLSMQQQQQFAMQQQQQQQQQQMEMEMQQKQHGNKAARGHRVPKGMADQKQRSVQNRSDNSMERLYEKYQEGGMLDKESFFKLVRDMRKDRAARRHARGKKPIDHERHPPMEHSHQARGPTQLPPPPNPPLCDKWQECWAHRQQTEQWQREQRLWPQEHEPAGRLVISDAIWAEQCMEAEEELRQLRIVEEMQQRQEGERERLQCRHHRQHVDRRQDEMAIMPTMHEIYRDTGYDVYPAPSVRSPGAYYNQRISGGHMPELLTPEELAMERQAQLELQIELERQLQRGGVERQLQRGGVERQLMMNHHQAELEMKMEREVQYYQQRSSSGRQQWC